MPGDAGAIANRKGETLHAAAIPQTRQQSALRALLPQQNTHDKSREHERSTTRRLATVTTRHMPCYHPITALQPTAGGPLVFPPPNTHHLYNDYRTVMIPCRQCSGCKLKDSRNWAIRCMHEKQMHRYNSFITCTYSPENLPANNALHYRHFQLFLKRTRALIGREWAHRKATALNAEYRKGNTNAALIADSVGKPEPIRFYMAGEYGETYGRPHYHALLFGLDFADRKYFRTTPTGSKIYTSQTLQNLWQLGFTSVGDLTFESAAYVARYIMTKRTGDGDKKNYNIIDLETGEIIKRPKEFNQMSRRPGIGSSWIGKYHTDIYTTGKVIVRGHPQNPPRYYDKQFKKIDQQKLEEIQYGRYIESLAYTEHQTPERLAVQEHVAKAKTQSLKRNLKGTT